MEQEQFRKYKRIFNDLKAAFDKEKATLKDIRDFIAPGMGYFLDKSGEEDNKIDYQQLLDEDVCGYFDITQNGLFSGLCNPASDWFNIEPADPELKDDYDAQLYCGEVKKRMRFLFDNAGFYPAVHKFFGEAPRFGYGAMCVEESLKDIVNFNVFTCGEAFFGIGADGDYDKMAFERTYRADEMLEKFGRENCPQKVKDAFEKGDMQTKFTVSTVLCPNFFKEPRKIDGANKPFICVYWLEGEEQPLMISGFDENPLAVLAWYRKNNRTVYPFGPGRLLLGSVRQIQNSTKNMIYNEDLVNMPPVNVHKDVGEPSLMPNGVNFTEGDADKAVVPVFKVDNRLDISQNRINAIKLRARSLSLADIMLIFAQQNTRDMTATQVNAIISEQMLMLGAVYLNAKAALDKIFERIFAIGLRRGFWPQPPESLQGTDLKVEYISAIALAQRATEINTMGQLIQFVMNLAQTQNDNIDGDFMTRRAAQALGVDPKCLVSESKRDEQRQALAQEQQRQALMQQEAAAAANAEKLSKASLAPDNALGALVKGAGE